MSAMGCCKPGSRCHRASPSAHECRSLAPGHCRTRLRSVAVAVSSSAASSASSQVQPAGLHHGISAQHLGTQTAEAVSAFISTTGAVTDADRSASPTKCPYTQLKTTLSNIGNSLQPSTSTAQPALSDTQPIPGPPPLSLEALKDVSVIFLKGLHVAMLHFSHKYGPICKFANPASLNGATSWVFLNSPDNIQHVCASNVRNYSRRYLPDIYKFVTHEKGILGSQDEYNARHRRLCGAPFRNKNQLQRFSSVVVDRSRQLNDIFREAAAAAGLQAQQQQGFVTDVATQTQRLTLDIVGLVAFSHDFQQVQQVRRDLQGLASDGSQLTDRVLWAVNTFGEVLAQIFITPLPLLKVLDRLGLPHLRQLDEAVRIMRQSMLDVIHQRRAALQAGQPGCDDLLQVLLTMTDDDGRGLSDEELWEDVHDVMGAGHETTATTTAALIYCISAHPHVRQRVERELQEVLGDSAPSYEDLERMPYLRACMDEVTRLYPAIPVFPREAMRGDVLPSGHAVSAGDVVFMSSYSLGRSPAIWQDPLKFDPDRFSPEAVAKQHRFQHLPFGAGPRMCLGASFAQMSVCLMAATLLQQFRFTPLTPSSELIPVEYDITMNFKPSGGLKMRVVPRAAAAAAADT